VKKKILILGVITIVIGLGIVGFDLILESEKDVSYLEEDYDHQAESFDSYQEGDTVILVGEITDRQNNTYVLDNSVDLEGYEAENHSGIGVFHSTRDFEIGDTLEIEYEINQREDGSEHVKTFNAEVVGSGFTSVFCLGGILISVGVLLIIIGFGKKEKGGEDKESEKRKVYYDSSGSIFDRD